MMSDIEKALFIEEVENSNFSDSLKEAFIEGELYPEKSTTYTIDEYIEWMDNLIKEIEDENN